VLSVRQLREADVKNLSDMDANDFRVAANATRKLSNEFQVVERDHLVAVYDELARLRSVVEHSGVLRPNHPSPTPSVHDATGLPPNLGDGV
jgi:hypothetical protein